MGPKKPTNIKQSVAGSASKDGSRSVPGFLSGSGILESNAFDRGLMFAFRNKKALFAILLLPLIVELAGYIAVQGAIPGDKRTFLVLISIYMANAWLLTAVTFFVFSKLKGELRSNNDLMLGSLTSMPKVFMSYIILIAILGFAIEVPPGLLAFFFLAWTPVFPALEQCIPLADPESEPLPDMEYDRDEEVKASVLADRSGLFSWFKFKSILDLGVTRSVRFSSMYWRESVLFLLLLWFVTVAPQALFNLLAGDSGALTILVMKQVLVSFPQVLVIAAGVHCLLSLLPDDGLEELELERPSLEMPEGKGIYKFSGSIFKTALVFVLSLASTIFLYQLAVESRRMPTDSVYELRRAYVVDGKFEVEVIIEDYQKNFAWFSPNQFQLQFTKSLEEESVKSKLIKPSKVLVYNQDDQRVFRENGFMSDGPLRMIASYSVPKDLSVEGFFELVFFNLNGELQKLVDERYPRGMPEE